MIPGFSTLINVPNVDYIRKYDLDELLDAKEVLGKVVAIVRSEFVGKKLDIDHISYQVKSLIRTVCQVQVESRGFPIDLHQVNELADEIRVEEVSVGCCEIQANPDWEKKVNQLLHVWVCPRCNTKILERQHSTEECRNNIISNVIDE